MKKGLSIVSVLLILCILIILIVISFNLYRYFSEARSLKEEVKNISEKDFNYYLPADFAAIKIKRGFFEANITGVIISFEDESKVYDYESNDYPEVDETKSFIILKDQLSPKVPDDWDFSKVKFVSLRYLLGENKISRVVTRIEVNADKISSGFNKKCFSVSEEEQQKISCE